METELAASNGEESLFVVDSDGSDIYIYISERGREIDRAYDTDVSYTSFRTVSLKACWPVTYET